MGGKKKGGSAHTPYEAPNTLYSKQIVKILDVLSEGPVEGFANGDTHPFKSTFFNDTPVQSENGDFNFKGFELAINDGDQDQVYLPEFDVVEKTNQVNADVKQDTPITRTVTDPYVSSVRVTVGVKGLVEMKDNGDRLPTSVTMTVSILKAGNYYDSKVVTIREKGTETYYQDVTFNDLPEAPFDIRVARVTPDSKTDKIQNATIFPSFVETIDAKLSYPFLAMAGYKFDAMQFGSSLPRINTLLKGRIVQIPTNYDPINRIYTGMWDGSFKLGWTDNPAWIIYDFVTNERYGGKIDPRYVDRAALYRVSQFCDELVDDGYGGKEPRVTFNAYYTDDKKFRDRLQDMCSAFFGHAIWNGKYLSFTLDNDEDPVALYTNANVVDGNFSYEGISNSAVITTVHVQYIDKNDAYRQKTEVVEDRDLLCRYRTNVQKVVAEGCTSRSQAHRLGRYILEKSRLRQTISFRIGAEGLKHRPFDVIQIADNHLAGTNIGGRVMAIEGKTVTLDREVENATKGTFSYLGVEEGKLKKIDLEITEQIDSKKLRLKEIPEDLRKFSAWSLSRSDVKPKYYRALGISQGNDGTFSIKAIEHEVGLQDRIAAGIKFEDNPTSIWTSYPEITNGTVGNNGDEVIITWDNINADTSSLTYTVKLYNDGRPYKTYPDLKEPVLRFDNLPSGTYVAEIQAKNNRGQLSNVLKQYFDLNYTITALQTKSELFSVKVSWTLPTIVSTDVSTEIWRAEKDNINDARLLVTLPYPQNEHVDSGMSVGEKYYYWARIVDKNDTTGEFTRSMLGEPKSDPGDLLNILDGAISEKQISKDLQDQFDKNIDDKIKPVADKVDEVVKDIEAIDVEFEGIHGDLTQVQLDAQKALEDAFANKTELEKQAEIMKLIEKTQGDSAAQQKLLELVNATNDKALYARSYLLEAKTGQNTAKIEQVETVMTTKTDSLAERLDTVYTSVDNNSSKITALDKTMTSEFASQALQIKNLEAGVEDNKANISRVDTAVVDLEKAQAKTNTELNTKIEESESYLKLWSLVESTNNKSLAQNYFLLSAQYANSAARIEQIQQAVATNELAITTVETRLNARIESNAAEIKRVDDARVTFEKSQAFTNTQLTTDLKDAKASIDQNAGAISELDKAQAVTNQNLEAGFKNSSAQQKLQSFVESTNDKSLAARVALTTAQTGQNTAKVEGLDTALTTEQEARAEAVRRLEAEAGANKASIEEVRSTTATVEGNVNSMWTMKLNANGASTGFMLGTDGEEGLFKVAADTFIISTSNQDVNMFTIQNVNGKFVAALNGDLIAKGTISAEALVADSFKGYKIDGVEINGGTLNIANGGFYADEKGTTIRDDQGTILLTTDKSLIPPNTSSGNVYLRDAIIETAQILDGSISASVSDVYDSMMDYKQYDIEHEISRLVVNTMGGRVLLQYVTMGVISETDRYGGNGRISFRIRRNGIQIKKVDFNVGDVFYWINTGRTTPMGPLMAIKAPNMALPMIVDTPPDGINIYTLTLERRGMDRGASSGASQYGTQVYDGSFTAFISKR